MLVIAGRKTGRDVVGRTKMDLCTGQAGLAGLSVRD